MATVDDTELITQAAYARRRGCSREAVRRQVDAKHIDAFGPDKLICPKLADAQWAERVRARADSQRAAPEPPPAAAPPGPPAPPPPAPSEATPSPPSSAPQDGGYNSWRVIREKADAEKAQMEAAEMAGRLIDRDGALSALFTAARNLRDALMPVGRRVAARAAAMTNPREVQLIVDEAQREALHTFISRTVPTIAARLARGPAGALPDDLVAEVTLLQPTPIELPRQPVEATLQPQQADPEVTLP